MIPFNRFRRVYRPLRLLSWGMSAALLFGACHFDPVPSAVPPEPDALVEEDAGGPFPGEAEPLQESDHLSNPEDDIEIDLSIPQTFAITRPTDELTVYYDTYFITGTSDPDLPVYCGDEEIERQGTAGLFGVHAELEYGENILTFRQGDETIEVVIRLEETDTDPAPIEAITQGSMFPAVRAGVKVGQEMPVSCIAPAGATVTAAFGGRTVKLDQQAVAELEGVPAFFRGYLPVEGDYSDDITENRGPVTYHLEFNGEESEYQSSGDVFVAGVNSHIALRVNNYIGFLYPDTGDLSVFREKLKLGATDYLKAQSNSYFELASGGFIPTEMADIVEGRVQLEGTLTKVEADTWEQGEIYTFHGVGTPVYHTRLIEELAEETEPAGEEERKTERFFLITLYNTYGGPQASPASGRLFSGIEALEEDTSVTYTFPLKEDADLWGYNVVFDDGNLLLEFRYKPSLSSSADTPFQGIRVLLDPGHGGSDMGAYGLPGDSGPTESDINLAHAYVLRDQLRELGAEVFLTRSADEYYTLDERLEDIEALGADVFLSLHHNSVAERSDANDISGMEIYYHDTLSRSMAEAMMEGLAAGLDRKSRSIQQSYYRVTLMAGCPAILMELGFMSNPLEYEQLTNPEEIGRVAEAVTQGLLSALR